MIGAVVEGRFHILESLGVGGMGTVYRVEDRAQANVVRALKILPRVNGQSSLRAEFLALARLRHENVVQVYDFGTTTAGDDYFTMEYIDGCDLLAAFVDAGDEGRLLRLIAGICRALSFLHGRGMVHADVKPSNLLVRRNEPDMAKAICLLDFGLAANATEPTAARARGTFPFAAPEVYAGRLDTRSDLYSLGVSLYRLVTGVFPYPGDEPVDVVRRQRRGPPVDPREHRTGVSAALAEMLVKLLDPEPAARFQSAEELLESVNRLAGTDYSIEGSGGAAPPVDFGATLVGRGRDLAELERLSAEARAGRGKVLLLLGEEGIGKSRLAAEHKIRTQLAGGHVVSVGSSSLTYQPLREIAAALASIAATFAPEALAARRAVLAPLLDDHEVAPEPAAGVASSDRRFAVFEAIAGLMNDVAAHAPLTLSVDDVGRADRTTREGLAYLARALPSAAVLLILLLRQDTGGETEARETLGLGAEHEHVMALTLAPLDRQSMHELLASTFGGHIADALGASLQRATGGNPAHALVALRMLAEQGQLRREQGAWTLASRHPVIPEIGNVAEWAEKRVAALEADVREVLSAAAVLGPQYELPALARIAGCEPVALARAVEIATTRGLRDATVAGGGLALVPSVVRALEGALPPAKRRTLHEAAIADLERERSAGRVVDDTELARHYLAVGDGARARAAVLAAARGHELKGEHAAAAALYEALLFLELPADERSQLLERLGDALASTGDSQGSDRAYTRAVDDLGSAENATRARLLRKLGESARLAGNQEQAIEILGRAVAAARAAGDASEEALSYVGLASLHLAAAAYPRAVEQARIGAEAATTAGVRARLRSIEGMAAFYQGDVRHAIRMQEEARETAAQGDDPVALAYVENNLGIVRQHAGDLSGAAEAFESARAIYERVGSMRQAVALSQNLAGVCWLRGEWERARKLYRRGHELAFRTSHRVAAAHGLGNLGMAAKETGDLAEAAALLDRALVIVRALGLKPEEVVILGNRAEVLHRQGDLPASRALFERAVALGEELGLKEQVCEDRRRLSELDLAAGMTERALDRSLDMAREAGRLGLRLEEGNLHRVCATALRLQGDLDSATWFLGKATEILTLLGAEHERAKVDVEAAELAAARGDLDGARATLDRAIEVFTRLGARWDLSKARERRRALAAASSRVFEGPVSSPRLEALLEVSRATGWVLDLERLLDLILDKTLEATGYDRGFLLLLDSHGKPTVRKTRVRAGQSWAEDASLFSGSIVRRVAESGEALSVHDVLDEPTLREQRSVIALRLRSALCAPMRSQGRLVGIIYVDSQDVPEHAGQDLALLEALAGQAAGVIENARLFAEQQRKTELMAMLAHEIRNPLTSILAFSELAGEAQAGDLPQRLRDDLERIHQSAQRLTRLVENILELSRVETGKVEWSTSALAIDAMLAEVAASFRPLAEKKGVVLEIGECHTAPAQANADRIFQVINNLVGNALKFTPSGGKITLRASEEAVAVPADEAVVVSPDLAYAPAVGPPGETVRRFVRVDVCDTGPGIEGDRLNRIFDKFGQAEAGKKKGGIGLGLYISREIVRQHRGSIWADSQPGKGTVFSVRLPVAD